MRLAWIIVAVLTCWVTRAEAGSCSGGGAAQLEPLVEDPTTTWFTATVTQQRDPRSAHPQLVARVTRVIAGGAVKVGDEVIEQGEPNGMKALSHLDQRITGPGAVLLVGCTARLVAVTIDDATTRGGIEHCVGIATAKSRAASATAIAAALPPLQPLGRACAEHALCSGDRATSALAIQRFAASYAGDPLTIWELMDGLRLASVNQTYARAIHCDKATQIVDPKAGADDANGLALEAQLALASRDKAHGTWLRDARAVLGAMPPRERDKLTAKLDSKLRALLTK